VYLQQHLCKESSSAFVHETAQSHITSIISQR